MSQLAGCKCNVHLQEGLEGGSWEFRPVSLTLEGYGADNFEWHHVEGITREAGVVSMG